jgi:hypothetical protein
VHGDSEKPPEPKDALNIYSLKPLDIERIELFCKHREVDNFKELQQEITNSELMELAGRPFDLESIVLKWKDSGRLGGRLEMLRANVNDRLSEKHSSARASRQPLNLDAARKGAQRLSAAVLLSGKTTISTSGEGQNLLKIDAEAVLYDWEPTDVSMLLERSIFNEPIYGGVRFRHREIIELLAAEWFDELLKNGCSRSKIEELFFRNSYSESITIPKLRRLLPWLCIFDSKFLNKVLLIEPNIVIEGGDVALLSILYRSKILTDIVCRISREEDIRDAFDNASVARIADIELEPTVSKLINLHSSNDHVMFYLARIVLFGKMATYSSDMLELAIKNTTDLYTRIVAARVVIGFGTDADRTRLWKSLICDDSEVPLKLFAALLNEVEPSDANIANVINILPKLAKYKMNGSIGLERSFCTFVEKIAVEDYQSKLLPLSENLYSRINEEPYCHIIGEEISEKYSWLLNFSMHIAVMAVTNKSQIATEQTLISTLLLYPLLRSNWKSSFIDIPDNLPSIVKSWPKINDALYWNHVKVVRAKHLEKHKEPLIDDWQLTYRTTLGSFDEKDQSRLLSYVSSKKLPDDKLIALCSSFRVYVQTGEHLSVLEALRKVVKSDSVLSQKLEDLLVNLARQKRKAEEAQDSQQQFAEQSEDLDRVIWINSLKADPSRVYMPKGAQPETCTNDHIRLMDEIRDADIHTSRAEGSEWQLLSHEFGNTIAEAYRDAAIRHWRYYTPQLRSEGYIYDNTVSGTLLFGLIGLEIEALENPNFPNNLSESEAIHAFRYLTWELNGFPSWIEAISKVHPKQFQDATSKELVWELNAIYSGKETNYILHDIVFYGKWFHKSIAQHVWSWLDKHPSVPDSVRAYCIQIILTNEPNENKLAKLAQREIKVSKNKKSVFWWYALWTDCEPQKGIIALDNWLNSIKSKSEATEAAQLFIVALVSGERHQDQIFTIQNYIEPTHLHSLYLLMHRYIRVEEDINRSGSGGYSPTLRDDSQDARDRLFVLLSNIPGTTSYKLIKDLIEKHSKHRHRSWMQRHARKRVETDSDFEMWSIEQFVSFHKEQIITPISHEQLFNFGVNRLLDLRDWLEFGNDSPWKTWQRIGDENEMRNLITGWLNQACRDQYTTAQEPELANNQRMDIWLTTTNIKSPVPIELKLLDKGWSGPKLCERLDNQLVGDYLREATASCGIFLLVSAKQEAFKKYRIEGKNVTKEGLAQALEDYWCKTSGKHPQIAKIKVIVIDLMKRALVSK